MQTLGISSLSGIYQGQIGYIVGKGPSLAHLRAEHFPTQGPVITLNQAVLVVQGLTISNPIYSMQKDGCGVDNGPDDLRRCQGDCEMRPHMVRPRADIPLILQYPQYSSHCMTDHPTRILVDPVGEMGFEHYSTMSINMAAMLIQVMGCSSLVFLCCDSFVGVHEYYDPQTGEVVLNHWRAATYAAAIRHLLVELGNFPFMFVLPEALHV
jgi:hypothetical protein